MGKYISLGKESNLDCWGDYAKRNSYGHNKHQMKEQLAPTGRHDAENDYKRGDWQETQRQSEGRGWAAMKPTTADNTFTGKGVTKHG